MSNYPAGWYPDGSGRFAQRYYDGQAWTEHVLDASGNRGTDPVGLGAPTQYGSEQYGQSSQPQAPSGGQQWGQPSGQMGTPAPQFGAPSAGQPYTSQAGAYGQAANETSGFTLTAGFIAAVGGAVLLLLSLFVLDFLSHDGQGASLGDIGKASSAVSGFLLDSYAALGRLLAILVIALAIVAVLRLPALRRYEARLPMITVIVVGVLALWHLLSMFVDGDLDASPAFGSFLGLLGYAGLGAGPFLRQRIGGPRGPR